MAETLISPGVFLRENDLSQIQQGPITVGAAILGPTVFGPVNIPTVVRSYSDYKAKFGALFVSGGSTFEYLTSIAALNYFEQGGETLLVTRVVSGTFTSATATVPAAETLRSGATASATLDLTGAATEQYTLNLNGTTVTLSGSTAQDVYNRATGSINAISGITASAFSTPTVTFAATTRGAIGNNYYYVSGSTTVNFTGGTDVTAFTLETISQGEVMNNNANAGRNNSSLISGSVNNVRWEVTFSDSGSGLFSMIVRRGDDYQNQKNVVETWNNLSLDPNTNNYIAYVIGDQSITPATDESGAYYLQYSGSYVNQSRYIRVKSVDRPTPSYLNNVGQAQAQYTSSLPLVGSGSLNGSFGGAVGTTVTAGPIKLYQDIPSTTATYVNNIQGVIGTDYNVGLGLIANKDQYDFKTVYAPGLTAQNASSQVTSLLSLAQERGTCIAVVDMVGYGQTITAATQQALSLDSSYGATYWPWVQLRSRETGKLFFCPASTIVPAVYEYNDKISAEWFAPAGLTRGGLTTVIQPERRLTVSQRDTLYANKVNPIAIFPGQGTVIYGQKTLQVKATALDRVNVRRLLIALKRYIGQIAETLIFEQNTQTTRNNFLNQVNPYLQYVQQKQGLYAFRVVMDETNNTPDVIDRNQLVGAIYLQPTKTAEYILLDFNILPTGASFGS
jgi:hypothetical protein